MANPRVIDATHHFDPAMALDLAAAADLAYAEPGAIEQTAVERWKSSHFCFFDVEATQGFVAADAHSIVVSFRGTEGDRVEDWMADLEFDLIDGLLGGRVHEGFYDALSCVWHVLDREVRQLQTEGDRRLWVTGHSLGAGLAALAVARWCAAERPVAGLYTFGQPRTGDATFARNFDFAFRPYAFRVVNNHDIVTRTPPRSLGYQHLGTLIYLTESGKISHDVSWWQQFLTGWNGAIDKVLDWGREGLEDHRMSNYRRRLEAALRGPATVRPEADGPPGRGLASEPVPTLIKPRRRAA